MTRPYVYGIPQRSKRFFTHRLTLATAAATGLLLTALGARHLPAEHTAAAGSPSATIARSTPSAPPPETPPVVAADVAAVTPEPAPPAAVVPSRERPAATTPSAHSTKPAKVDCEPPYTTDARGHRRYKAACFH